MYFISKLLDRYRDWKKERYWKARQLEHLRVMVQSDLHWMAHDPTVRILAQRYLNALNEHWYTFSFEHSDKLRTRLGLDPEYKITYSTVEQTKIQT